MNKPIIALTPRVDTLDHHSWVQSTYLNCVTDAGAIPVLLPCPETPFSPEELAEIVSRFDGILVIGGPDLHPGLFGEERLPACGEICPERDSLDLPLMAEAVRQNKAVLGICRGLQVMNVALGGTLYQDIPSQFPASLISHAQEAPYEVPVHRVNIIRGTPLHELLKTDTMMVNSMHHQSIAKLAPQLHAMATADDGVIEAVYHTKRDFVVGVQWHPEWLGMQVPETEKLFCAFIDACQKE